MPTPSDEIRRPKSENGSGDWAARTDKPRRSVFGNYTAIADGVPASGSARLENSEPRAVPETAAPTSAVSHLQLAIDQAVARSFIHRFLAQAYEDPTPESWAWLCDATTQANLGEAGTVAAGILPAVEPGFQPGGKNAASTTRPENLGGDPCSSAEPGGKMLPSPAGRMPAATAATFDPAAFDSFRDAYVATFGHAARGPCPMNEIEYGTLKADSLFQPHRLADLTAFYRAFGLELADDAAERPDHICLELEFMSVLAAKEAYALEHQLDADQLAVVRDAQKKFLREHLGHWLPAFTRRLEREAGPGMLATLARLTRGFVLNECARFAVTPGSEDLLLRPVDETERMCESCGLTNNLPGALAAI